TEQGTVRISVDLQDRSEGEVTLMICVADTGIGIPQEQQQTIFTAFHQADTSSTRRFGGTGLGLAISTHLVALMGGKIWVESALVMGSKFYFTTLLKGADETSASLDSVASGDLHAPLFSLLILLAVVILIILKLTVLLLVYHVH